jgi:hypothetical protein
VPEKVPEDSKVSLNTGDVLGAGITFNAIRKSPLLRCES